MSEHQEPKTETLPKAVKKSFISWVVPSLCLGIVMACFMLVQNWADGRYDTKSNASQQVISLQKSLDSEQMKREDLGRTMSSMDRKLDLMLYVMQRDGKIDQETVKRLSTGP